MLAHLFKPGIELIEGGKKRYSHGNAQTDSSQEAEPERSWLGNQQLTANFAKPDIKVASLAHLANSPAKWFNIEWFLELGQLTFLPLDLIEMAGDCFASNLGLAAELGEPLAQPPNNHRFIGPKAECLGRVQISGMSQLAQDTPCLVLDVLLIVLKANTIATCFDRAQSLLERFDLTRSFQQQGRQVELS